MIRRYLLSLSLCLPLLAGCWCVATVPDADPIHEVEPVVSEGLRVLIVHESGSQPSATRGQLSILASTKVNEYLTEKCSRGWRKIDQNDLKGDWKEIADASKPARLPWLYICDGKRIVYSDTLPDDVPAFMALVGKYDVR